VTCPQLESNEVGFFTRHSLITRLLFDPEGFLDDIAEYANDAKSAQKLVESAVENAVAAAEDAETPEDPDVVPIGAHLPLVCVVTATYLHAALR
jgi:hypothetical protein